MAKTYPVVRRHSVAFLGLGTRGIPWPVTSNGPDMMSVYITEQLRKLKHGRECLEGGWL